MTTERLLTVLVLLQSATLLLLVADRLVPEAHAADGVSCHVDNWPDVLTGVGFATMRVKLEEVNGTIPVVVKDWDTSDTVKTSVIDWDATDEVRVSVRDWSTSDVVSVRN